MSEKYLKYFPKPLLDDLVKGKWLPFIGAGFSKNALLPKDKEMPDWNQLAKLFFDEMDGYSFSDPIDIISDYQNQYSRNKLLERLFLYLNMDYAKPGIAHKALSNIPFNTICTTNFDDLIEKSYIDNGRSFYIITDENQLGLIDTSIRTSIFKIHGDFNHPNRMILTEDDYDLFLTNYPLIATYFANLLICHNPIFIGYSLNDPDLRLIWKVVRNRLGNLQKQAYTISVDLKVAEIKRFERRKINVINLPMTKSYEETFRFVFEELREYYLQNAPKHYSITDSEVENAIVLNPGISNKLCYFSIPSEGITYYKDNIFPIAFDNGFVPALIDDISTQGTNIRALTESLISRSSVMVIDFDSKNAEIEFELGKDYISIDNILRLSSVINLPISDYAIIKPDSFQDPYNNIRYDNDFLAEINHWFAERKRKLFPDSLNEPARLFELKEYRAAVITAISLLESSLRKTLEERDYLYQQSKVTLVNLVKIASKHDLLSNNQINEVFSWIRIRNAIVHNDDAVSKKKAHTIVSGVTEIIQEMSEREY